MDNKVSRSTTLLKLKGHLLLTNLIKLLEGTRYTDPKKKRTRDRGVAFLKLLHENFVSPEKKDQP